MLKARVAAGFVGMFLAIAIFAGPLHAQTMATVSGSVTYLGGSPATDVSVYALSGTARANFLECDGGDQNPAHVRECLKEAMTPFFTYTTPEGSYYFPNQIELPAILVAASLPHPSGTSFMDVTNADANGSVRRNFVLSSE